MGERLPMMTLTVTEPGLHPEALVRNLSGTMVGMSATSIIPTPLFQSLCSIKVTAISWPFAQECVVPTMMQSPMHSRRLFTISPTMNPDPALVSDDEDSDSGDKPTKPADLLSEIEWYSPPPFDDSEAQVPLPPADPVPSTTLPAPSN